MTTAAINSDGIRILLVDSHAVVRAGLKMLIEQHSRLIVVGEAATARDAIRTAIRETPDVIVLDLDLGVESGLDVLTALNKVHLCSRVLVLTGSHDSGAHRRAVRLGAVGLVLKEKAPDVVIKAIEKVHAGEVWLDRVMIARVLGELLHHPSGNPPSPEAVRIAQLTGRQREVVALIGKGHKNRQIADLLCISEATVRHHLTSIFSKLGLTDRVDLVIYAYRHGLAELP